MTTQASTYRVLGTTDDCTTCDVCGRDHLKGTVVLDTGDGELYAGTGCAAKLAGRPVRDIHREARDADRTRKDAEHAARREVAAVRFAVEEAATFAYVARVYGVTTTDRDTATRAAGTTWFRLLRAARTA